MIELIEEHDSRFVREMYPQTGDLLMREGWDDPAMNVYNDPNYPSQ